MRVCAEEMKTPPRMVDTVRRLFIPPDRSSTVVRYGFAVCCFIFAFLLRLIIEPRLGEHSPLLIFSLAIVASSIRAGVGPGLFATILSTVGALYFLQPVHALAIQPAYLETAIFQLGLFIVVGGAMSWLGGEVRRSRWQAEDFAAERQQILDSITDGFAAFDRDGRLLYQNRSIDSLTGTEPLFPMLADRFRRVMLDR